jgi:hypothetical protein
VRTLALILSLLLLGNVRAAEQIGYLDSVTCAEGISGWVKVGDAPVTVNIYIDGDYSKSVMADQSRPDLIPYGYGELHGFTAPIPASRRDGHPHTYYATVKGSTKKIPAYDKSAVNQTFTVTCSGAPAPRPSPTPSVTPAPTSTPCPPCPCASPSPPASPSPSPTPPATPLAVSWNANKEPDLAGYHINIGPEHARYTRTETVGVMEHPHTIINLAAPAGYFTVSAFNDKGDEGPTSPEVKWP